MTLNIPMPDLPGNSFLKGIDTGGALFSRLMQPRLERERQVLDREKQKQLDQHFLQKLMAEKEAAERSQAFQSRFDPQKMAIMQQQLLGLKQRNDPNYELNKFMHAAKVFGGGSEGMNLDQLKQNPLLRGFFKHQLGFDPLAPTPLSPDEKIQSEIEKATKIDEAKSNRKKLDEIEKTAQALLPYLGKVNTIADILKRKPDLAGLTAPVANMLGMTKDEDVGTFLSAAQALQAHMAKEMSSRGGYGVSKLVEQAKPNLGKSTAYNIGVIKDLKQSMKESFEQMKSEYERLSNGKKFPYNFEQYFKEVTGSKTNDVQGGMVPMISPNGKRVMIPSDKVDAALASGGKYA